MVRIFIDSFETSSWGEEKIVLDVGATTSLAMLDIPAGPETTAADAWAKAKVAELLADNNLQRADELGKLRREPNITIAQVRKELQAGIGEGDGIAASGRR